MSTVTVGSTVILDGQAWTAGNVEGHALHLSREADGRTASAVVDARDVEAMGAGLFTIPGRTERRLPREGELGVAQADIRKE